MEAEIAQISFADPEVQKCPFDAYRRLHETERVHQDPVTGFWEVLRHEDLLSIIRDPVKYSSEHKIYGDRSHSAAYEQIRQLYESEGFPPTPALINSDEPTHRRNRNLIDDAFRPARIEELEPYIRELVNMLAARWAGKGKIEFVADFAMLLPLYVISDTLGISRNRALDFKRWSDAMMEVHDPHNTVEQQVAYTRTIIEMQRFFADALEAAKANPKDDVLGDLARGTIDGEPVPTGLAVHILSSLLVAGNESTTATLGSAMKRLIETPGLEETLRAEPRRIPDFIEEVLRLDPPLPCQFRRNVEAVSFDEAELPQDSIMVMRFGAGNRDPRRFPDPDRFDMDRPRLKQHLAFGAGTHMCVGHLLARTEMRIAFEQLLARFRNFRLDGEPTPLTSYLTYGPRTLPIAFDPA